MQRDAARRDESRQQTMQGKDAQSQSRRAALPARARQAAAKLPQRRPAVTLAMWAAAISVLAVLGTGVAARLSPISLEVPGTPSSRAEATLRARFGNSIPIAILLRGPSAAVNREGEQLAAALRDVPRTEVLSPWQHAPIGRGSGPTLSALLPHPGAAFVLVNYERSQGAAMTIVPKTEALLKRTVPPPVHAYLTGVAVIGRAIQQQTLKDTEQAEAIALPTLILVLLLVFRSPVAAGVPLVMGGATVIAGRGLLWLASFLTPINSLGIAIAAMMSLALGVDYALLMVSRVRQELANGMSHASAVEAASRSAGRTIAAAGGTLALTMLAASAVATPGLLGPVAIGVVLSGLLSVALALSAMPALLLLLGPLLNRWEIRLRRRRHDASRSGRARALADLLIARPAITVPLILLPMLLLALPASAMKMGPPDASELPASSPAREAMAMVQRTIGAGWAAPFVIVASAHEGAITTPQRLRELIRFQEQIAAEPDVAAVLGPASVAGARAKLAEAHTAMVSAPQHLRGARKGITQLRGGLRRASEGVSRLRNGLTSAASGAGALSAGATQAQQGAGRLAAGAGQAHRGARRITTEAGRAHRGAQELATETARAHKGARRITTETGRAHKGAQKLATETKRASTGSERLHAGLDEAATGAGTLATGLDEASAGAERLAAGDNRLSAGAARLAQGMNALDQTVHIVLTPIEALASRLQSWAQWLQSLEASDAQVIQGLEEAIGEVRALPVPHDSQYEALVSGLEAVDQRLTGNELAQLSSIKSELRSGIEALAALPQEISQLTSSLDQLTAGADSVAAGAQESQEGAQQLNLALHKLAAGGHTLSDGLSSLSGGAGRLAGGLGKLTSGQQRLANGLGKLHSGDRRLSGGLHRLHSGDRRLSGGLHRLQQADGSLTSGLGRVAVGERGLIGGLRSLSEGGSRLASGLSGGERQTRSLGAGLASASHPLRTYQTMLEGYERDYETLQTDSPRALDSGYLVLTALDGTVSPVREQVAQMVNVDSGGQAARFIVVADSAPSSQATVALSARLRRSLPMLAAKTGASVQIGEGAQYLLDYRNANTARFPWLVLTLAVVATLTLIVVLRALLLPVIAVVLNLATIFVALGALQMLTGAHLLGGPGYIDAASGAGVISIMFVLSIDYEVFLLTRMREHWQQRHDAAAAIDHGLKHTAGVITGSAAIMTAVFLAFSLASVVPLRQFGTGLTFAVLLDATIVRLVLLPAIMRLIGARIWWMPDWLGRRLPAIE